MKSRGESKGKIIIKKTEPDTFKPQKMFDVGSALGELSNGGSKIPFENPNKFFILCWNKVDIFSNKIFPTYWISKGKGKR